MSKEIERKFLVKKVPDLKDKQYKEYIEQYYLSKNPEIRIRKVKEIWIEDSAVNYYMTIKSEGNLVRDELEFKIYPDVFNQLKAQVKDDRIIKTRYYLPLDKDFIAQLDIYHSIVLLTVEVEFKSINEANSFNPPDWFGREVTEDKRYKNKNLAKYGLDLDIK